MTYVRYDAAGKITNRSTVGFAAGAAQPDPPMDANGQADVQLGQPSETVSVSLTIRYDGGLSTHLGPINYQAPILLPPLPRRQPGR